MKKRFALFVFNDAACGTVEVSFHFDPAGKPLEVHVRALKRTYVIDNRSGGYKPCQTHCETAAAAVLGKKPRDGFDRERRQRTRVSKPKLRVIGGQS